MWAFRKAAFSSVWEKQLKGSPHTHPPSPGQPSMWSNHSNPHTALMCSSFKLLFKLLNTYISETCSLFVKIKLIKDLSLSFHGIFMTFPNCTRPALTTQSPPPPSAVTNFYIIIMSGGGGVVSYFAFVAFALFPVNYGVQKSGKTRWFLHKSLGFLTWLWVDQHQDKLKSIL